MRALLHTGQICQRHIAGLEDLKTVKVAQILQGNDIRELSFLVLVPDTLLIFDQKDLAHVELGPPLRRLGQHDIVPVDAFGKNTQKLHIPDIAVEDVPLGLVQKESDMCFHSRIFPLDHIVSAMSNRNGVINQLHDLSHCIAHDITLIPGWLCSCSGRHRLAAGRQQQGLSQDQD